MTRLLWIPIVCGIAACGPGNAGPNITYDNNQNGRLDMGDDAPADTGTDTHHLDVRTDATADLEGDTSGDGGTNNSSACDPLDCDDGEECRDGNCVVADSCDAAHDLGELSPGDTLSHSGNLFSDGADSITATCGEANQRERVLQFELTATARVNYQANWMGQFDGLVEFRAGCADDTTSVFCSDLEVESPILEPGTYFVVLETRFGNPGDFSFSLSAEAVQCIPGERTCVADELQVCSDPTEPETFQCAGGCADATCGGDTCAHAIEVTAATGGTFEGVGGGYSSALDFSANTDCVTADDMPIATPGYDVVFFLPGLQTSDVVSIDAQTADPNINAIFILQACDDTSACVAAFKNQQPDWVVDAPGDYYVVIDKRNATNTEFHYTVQVL